MNAAAAALAGGKPVRLPSALLSIEESARTTRSLRAWPAAMQCALAERVAEAARLWARGWELPASFDAAPADDDLARVEGRTAAAGSRWNAVSDARPDVAIWWTTSANGAGVPPRRLLLAAMFDETGISASDERMADALTDQAWRDWCDRLVDLFGDDTPSPGGMGGMSPQALPVLDGSVQVRLSWFGGEQRLVVGGELVARWMAANAPAGRAASPGHRVAALVPVLRALGDRPIALRVELGQVDVDLGALMALRPGDIFCTGHSLDAPLDAHAASGLPSARPPICNGYLGARDGWRAIELHPSDAES